MKISIIIRTYNEERCIGDLLSAIQNQDFDKDNIETIIIDSGSTDKTLSIVNQYNCLVVHIKKQDFSFGKSLNLGCETAKGEILVFISGHCIPENSQWLKNLVTPLGKNNTVLTYGRQIGGKNTKFSENRIFQKYYPKYSQIPQDGFFCNNANSALLKSTWLDFKFDEKLTGLEDMYLAKELVLKKFKVAYTADSTVLHLHDESWTQIRRRFEREAIALAYIMPDIKITVLDFIRYLVSSITFDLAAALKQHVLISKFYEIIAYRTMQYTGTYRGNHMIEEVSNERKDKYFFPDASPSMEIIESEERKHENA